MSALGAAILGRREKQTTVYDDDEPETSAFPVQMNLNHEECPFPRPAVINFESARYRKLKSLIDVDISGARGAFGQMRGVQSFGQAEPWVPASAYLVNSRCESLRKYPKYWLEVKLTNGRSFFVGCVHKKGKRGEKEFRSYWSFPKVHLTHHLVSWSNREHFYTSLTGIRWLTSERGTPQPTANTFSCTSPVGCSAEF